MLKRGVKCLHATRFSEMSLIDWSSLSPTVPNRKPMTLTKAAALEANGLPALLGGNLGHSLLADEERWHEDAVAVLEVSSFQLERIDPQRHSQFPYRKFN